MKKIICLLMCIFTVVCCFGCANKKVCLKYKIEDNAVCFMTPNGESLMDFFGIDNGELYGESLVCICLKDDKNGTNQFCANIGNYNWEKSYFTITTYYDKFSETLIDRQLKECKFIYVYFYQYTNEHIVGSQEFFLETTSRTIFENEPVKLIKVS